MSPAFSILALSLLSALTSATIVPSALLLSRQTNSTANNTVSTQFKDIVPSTKLNWRECYLKGYQCAYLTVPLDYKNPGVGTTDIAFMRYLVSEDVEDLLFNPGGPGESGIKFLAGSASVYANRWGFNPVSFDPRGVGFTKLQVGCGYANRTTRRDVHTLPDLHDDWNQAIERNTACSIFNKNTTAKYVGTSAVVQDMVHFTEVQAAARGKDPKKVLINYNGVSYGTLIGQTLVAMYPQRLGRVLLDANVYGVAHYQGWEPSGIDDFAHGIWLFNKLCYEAGEKWCILAAGAKSIDEVYERFDHVYMSLRENPLVVNGEPYDHNSFIGTVQGAMYSPSSDEKGYLAIANVTASLLDGHLDFKKAKMMKRDNPVDTSSVLGIITSVDIANRYPFKTYEQWKAQADKLESTAPYYAQGYSTSNGLIGVASNIMPPPSQFFPGFRSLNTSNPVLFINTNGDPVTPTASARQMSKYFSGSGVIIVDGPGHGFEAAPSKCAYEAVNRYFRNGTVPRGEMWCKTDVDASYYFGADRPKWLQQYFKL